MSASTQCPHSDLHFNINHQAFDDTNLHYLEIGATCNICGAHMAFQGMPVGATPQQPTTSLQGTTAILPFWALGEDLTGNPVGYTVASVHP